jgi:DNA-binding beta-propeller fold protein YncE
MGITQICSTLVRFGNAEGHQPDSRTTVSTVTSAAVSGRRAPGLRAILLTIVVVLGACGNSTSQPSGPRVVATLHVGVTPGVPVLGGGFVWVPNSADGTVSKIDPRSDRVVDTIRVGDPARLRKRGCTPPNVHDVPVGSFLVRLCDIPSALAFGAGSLWAARGDGPDIVRIDPRSDHVLATIPLAGQPFGLAFGPSGLWVTDWLNDSLSRVDPEQNQVVATHAGLGGGAAGLLVTSDAVWVSESQSDLLLRVDPHSLGVVARIPVGRLPLALADLGGAVWVRNEKGSSVDRIDPAQNAVVTSIPVGFFLGRDGQDGIGLTSRGLWVGGLDLELVDPARARVSARVPLSAVAVAGDGKADLWTSDLAGTVSHVVAPP